MPRPSQKETAKRCGNGSESEETSYSRGRKNSRPHRRISPAEVCLRTFAAIGGVSVGSRLDVPAGDGAGIVKLTTWSGRRKWVEAMHAPVALMFRVFVSSMNSAPDASIPRRNTGT